MIQLWQALDTFFTVDVGAADLRTVLTGGMHNYEAPRTKEFPFGTFQLVSCVQGFHATAKNYLEDCLVQFNLFSKKHSMTELLGIYDALIACFDYVDLPIDDYICVSCIRQDSLQLRVEDVWQMNVTYRILLEP